MRNGASQPGPAAKSLVRKVRPRLAFGATQKHHPVAPLLERFRPRQAREPERKNAARERQRGRLVLRDGKRLLGEDERAEPATAARPQRGGGAVEAQFVRGLDRRARDPLDVVERERRGGEDARRGGAAGDFADGEDRARRPSGSCASSAAARPLAMRNSPRLP